MPLPWGHALVPVQRLAQRPRRAPQGRRERVEHAARVLPTSDGWQRWIKVRASDGLSRYSLTNQREVLQAEGDALGRIAGGTGQRVDMRGGGLA